MNKSELVSRLTERLGGDRTIATEAVNGVLAEIEDSVARGERVSLLGFGTFDRRERAPRTGRNPQTGATLQLPASVAPVFRPGAGFRSLVTQNGSAIEAAPEPEPVAVKNGKDGKKKAVKAAKSDPDKSAKKAVDKKAVAKAPKKPGKKTGKKAR